MSNASKARRKELRGKIRAVMAATEAEDRAKLKRPPLWVRFKAFFRPVSLLKWRMTKEQAIERRKRYAFRKTFQQVRGRV